MIEIERTENIRIGDLDMRCLGWGGHSNDIYAIYIAEGYAKSEFAAATMADPSKKYVVDTRMNGVWERFSKVVAWGPPITKRVAEFQIEYSLFLSPLLKNPELSSSHKAAYMSGGSQPDYVKFGHHLTKIVNPAIPIMPHWYPTLWQWGIHNGLVVPGDGTINIQVVRSPHGEWSSIVSSMLADGTLAWDAEDQKEIDTNE